MKSISDISSHEIAWVQPDWRKRDFEIRAGEDTVGTLDWKADIESLAIAKSADGVWSFKHGGFMRPWVTVRAEGKDWDVARFHLSNWNGSGFLTLGDGWKIRWGLTNMWGTEWRWDCADGTPLISIKTEPPWEENGGFIKIYPLAETATDISLLTLLGCYLIVLRWDDMSAEALAG